MSSNLIDELVIYAMQESLCDPAFCAYWDAEWCELRGVCPVALERVRETYGANPDARVAAKNAFQLGFEIREPQAPRSRDGESEIDQLQRELLDQETRRISAPEIAKAHAARDWKQSDSAWCDQHGVSPAALDRIRETYGRSPDPRIAAVSAFQTAIEARRFVADGGRIW